LWLPVVVVVEVLALVAHHLGQVGQAVLEPEHHLA
jgi:hypothetical protein